MQKSGSGRRYMEKIHTFVRKTVSSRGIESLRIALLWTGAIQALHRRTTLTADRDTRQGTTARSR
jgi:hypothetical protein